MSASKTPGAAVTPPLSGSAYRRAAATAWAEGGQGYWVKPLFEDPATGERTLLMRIAPGTVSHPHAHEGEFEQIFMVEGTFEDDSGALKPGDYAYFLAPPSRAPLLDRLFSASESAGALPFGELQFAGDVKLGAIGEMYSLPIPPDQATQTLAEYFANLYDHAPSAGDAATIGPLTLTVRETEGDGVSKVGLDILSFDQITPRVAFARTRSLLRGMRRRDA